MAHMNNTFTLSGKPDIKIIISGMVVVKQQGIYDLPASGNVSGYKIRLQRKSFAHFTL